MEKDEDNTRSKKPESLVRHSRLALVIGVLLILIGILAPMIIGPEDMSHVWRKEYYCSITNPCGQDSFGPMVMCIPTQCSVLRTWSIMIGVTSLIIGLALEYWRWKKNG